MLREMGAAVTPEDEPKPERVQQLGYHHCTAIYYCTNCDEWFCQGCAPSRQCLNCGRGLSAS